MSSRCKLVLQAIPPPSPHEVARSTWGPVGIAATGRSHRHSKTIKLHLRVSSNHSRTPSMLPMFSRLGFLFFGSCTGAAVSTAATGSNSHPQAEAEAAAAVLASAALVEQPVRRVWLLARKRQRTGKPKGGRGAGVCMACTASASGSCTDTSTSGSRANERGGVEPPMKENRPGGGRSDAASAGSFSICGMCGTASEVTLVCSITEGAGIPPPVSGIDGVRSHCPYRLCRPSSVIWKQCLPHLLPGSGRLATRRTLEAWAREPC